MKTNKSLYSRKLLKIVLSFAAGLLATHLLLQYLNLEVFYQQNGQVYELSNRLDLDDETSVPTWFSYMTFFGTGCLALLAGYLQKDAVKRRLWVMIGSLALLFSLDEAAGLHEFFLQTLHVIFFQDAAPTESDNAWLLVAPFIFAVGLWLIWKMFRLLPRRTVVLFAVSGVIFLSGAVIVDLLTSVTDRETFTNQGLMVGAEEGMELFGSVIALYAVANYLEIYHGPVLTRAFRQLRAP